MTTTDPSTRTAEDREWFGTTAESLDPTWEEKANVPDEAATIVSTMLEQFLSGHLDDADREGDDWSGAHPISVEGDARAIVAAVTPIITAQALAEVRKNQIGMARGFIHNAETERRRAGQFQWSKHHSAAAAEGWAHGAVQTLQMLLMALGEVEYDEAAETTYEIVTSEGASDEG